MAWSPSTLIASVCFGLVLWDNTHDNKIIGKFAPFQNQSTPGLEETAVPKQGGVEGAWGSLLGQETQPDSLEAFVGTRSHEDEEEQQKEEAKKEAVEKAEKEAEAKAKKDAEENAKKEAEAKMKKEAEEMAKSDAKAKAKKQAEEKAKKEAEANLKKEAEEKAKKNAEAKAKKQAEEKAKEEAEAKTKKEAEEKAKKEAEATPAEAMAELLAKGQKLLVMLASALASWLITLPRSWIIFAMVCADFVLIVPFAYAWRRWRKRPAEELRVLETQEEVQELVSGKRLLHVKGFGSGFKEPGTAEHMGMQQQEQSAVQAIKQFRPDYLVVDGDPFGSGFQWYIKAYVDGQVEAGLAVPKLLWVKNVKGSSPTPEELEKNKKKAREWADQGLQVVVSWLPEATISEGVDRLFGEGCWDKLQGQKFDFRGAVRLLEAAEPERLEWLRGLAGTAHGGKMYKAIEAVEGRADDQYFEKCSFENAAKGNAIYQHLRGEGREPAAQGATSFGGGESVLLEFATLYLFPGSGFDAGQAALFPFSRGRPDDPALPAHEGHAFRSEKQLHAKEEDEDKMAAAGGA